MTGHILGPLSGAPLELLKAIAALPEMQDQAADILTAQTHAAQVTSYSPTYIDLDIPEECPAGPWPNGPLKVSPDVLDENGEIFGGIHVFARHGRLVYLEQFWYLDDPPTEWPSLERIKFIWIDWDNPVGNHFVRREL